MRVTSVLKKIEVNSKIGDRLSFKHMRWDDKTVKVDFRDVLFEFHLKFWNTASIGNPVRSLL